MDEDSITFGRLPEPDDRATALGATLRDVFDASYRKLVVQLYAITGDHDEAEDLVQEAFVKAVSSGRRFLRVDNKEAWLRTTAINAHRSRWRKKRNGRRALDRLPRPRDPAALEEHVEIINALRALPEQQRHAVALYYLADLPVGAIAAELGVPEGTVKSRLGRGREALANSLAPVREGVDHV